jgi:hypothetical protein
MALESFLSELFEHGQVRVAPLDDASGNETKAVEWVLREFEASYRQELPGDAPEFALEPALWGATMLYRASQLLVFRDAPAKLVTDSLAAPCPRPVNPATCYAVDLTFRFLPDLIKLARIASSEDPLVERLMVWVREWPLSSVGVAGVGPVQIGGFVDNACLLAVYVDRIIERRDVSRLGDARIRTGVRQALGLFNELAPEMAAAVAKHETDSPARQESGATL